MFYPSLCLRKKKGGQGPPFLDLACGRSALRGDVLLNDGLNGPVGGELGQRAVHGVHQSGVALGHADGVVLVGILGVQNDQAGVGGHELLGRGLVDDHGVHLAVEQILHGHDAVVIGDHMVLAVVVGAVDVAGGGPLGADELLAQVVQSDVGALGHDDDLDAGGVAVREVHDQQAVLGDGQAGHADVALTLLDRQLGGVEVHVVNDQLQAQLVSDGAGDLGVDAHHIAAVVGHLIGREGGIGGHDELAGLHGGQLGGGAGAAGAGAGVPGGRGHAGGSGGGGGSGAASGAAAGGQAQGHGQGQGQSKKLFHSNRSPLFWCPGKPGRYPEYKPLFYA